MTGRLSCLGLTLFCNIAVPLLAHGQSSSPAWESLQLQFERQLNEGNLNRLAAIVLEMDAIADDLGTTNEFIAIVERARAVAKERFDERRSSSRNYQELINTTCERHRSAGKPDLALILATEAYEIQPFNGLDKAAAASRIADLMIEMKQVEHQERNVADWWIEGIAAIRHEWRIKQSAAQIKEIHSSNEVLKGDIDKACRVAVARLEAIEEWKKQQRLARKEELKQRKAANEANERIWSQQHGAAGTADNESATSQARFDHELRRVQQRLLKRLQRHR